MSVNKNPAWLKDELILALDLYFRLDMTKVNEQNAEIIELSQLLNKLSLHPTTLTNEKFRNPVGVNMKLRNFIQFDSNYSINGLQRGGKLEKIVWDEFAYERLKLSALAGAIKESYKYFSFDEKNDEEEIFSEGTILTKLHRYRERNSAIVKKKKKIVLQITGQLKCEVCEFDFGDFYGDLGYGFAECHHLLPLAALPGEVKAKLSDLAIVCANCHRMLHRTRDWLSLDSLKKIIKKQAKKRTKI